MFASILIPLVILGGMDGVEPLRASAPLREMKAKAIIVIRRAPRMAGLSAAADRLGVSRTQLREVINGNRKSKRLMARLRDAGIKVVA